MSQLWATEVAAVKICHLADRAMRPVLLLLQNFANKFPRHALDRANAECLINIGHATLLGYAIEPDDRLTALQSWRQRDNYWITSTISDDGAAIRRCACGAFCGEQAVFCRIWNKCCGQSFSLWVCVEPSDELVPIGRSFADWMRLWIHCAGLGSGIKTAAPDDEAAVLVSSAERSS